MSSSSDSSIKKITNYNYYYYGVTLSIWWVLHIVVCFLPQILMSAEDEGDAQAAAEARAEQAAELAEFDEAYAAHNDGSQVRILK